MNKAWSPCRLLGGVLAWSLLLLGTSLAASSLAWPSFSLPKNVQAVDAGQNLTANGLAMHLQAFVSSASPAELSDAFRQRLGHPVVENTLGTTQILGCPQGEYYLTVQIEPAGKGSRGIAAFTHPKIAAKHQSEAKAETEYWLMRLPAGSKILSHVSSEDAGKTVHQLLIQNSLSEALNRERLQHLMEEEGFTSEHKHTTKDTLSDHSTPGQALYFKGKNKEAMATISRNANDQTSLILNLITTIETFP